jgi:hypothetical protein
MRFPFISRRRAQASVDLAVTAVWHLVDEAEAATCEARIEQRQAESRLAAEQKLRRHAVAYVEQAEGRRDADGHRAGVGPRVAIKSQIELCRPIP